MTSKRIDDVISPRRHLELDPGSHMAGKIAIAKRKEQRTDQNPQQIMSLLPCGHHIRSICI